MRAATRNRWSDALRPATTPHVLHTGRLAVLQERHRTGCAPTKNRHVSTHSRFQTGDARCVFWRKHEDRLPTIRRNNWQRSGGYSLPHLSPRWRWGLSFESRSLDPSPHPVRPGGSEHAERSPGGSQDHQITIERTGRSADSHIEAKATCRKCGAQCRPCQWHPIHGAISLSRGTWLPELPPWLWLASRAFQRHMARGRGTESRLQEPLDPFGLAQSVTIAIGGTNPQHVGGRGQLFIIQGFHVGILFSRRARAL